MKKQFLLFIIVSFPFLSLFSQRNCTTHEYHESLEKINPEYSLKRKSIEQHTAANLVDASTEARSTITIPVVIHIVWRTNFPTENISNEQILSQIDVLNKDFRRLNSDATKTPSVFSTIAADCGINFCLAKQNPLGQPTTGINRVQASRTTSWGSNDAVKNPVHGGVTPWDPSRYLNIYVCEIGSGILGYAPYPGVPYANEGIVVDCNAFGTLGTAVPPYHLGRTTTHEVGHWLNLNHIWGDANCGNDMVNDTPLHQTSNSGCPAFPHYNTCSSATEMPSNYMDYTDDICMNLFTKGQSARMLALFAPGGARHSLTYSTACNDPENTVLCNAPFLLGNTIVSNTDAKLSWNAVTNGITYTLEYREATAATWTIITTTNINYTLSALKSGVAYKARVRTNCTNSTSLYSNEVIFATTSSCGTPNNFLANNITTTSASISWSATTPAPSSYNVLYRKAGTTTWTNLTTVSKNYLLQNLAPNTSYEVQITGLCDGNTKSLSLTGSFKTIAPSTSSCGAVGSLSATFIAETSAKISWSPIIGATSYTIYFKVPTALSWSQNGSATSNITLQGLIPSTTYLVKVVTLCNGATSSDSPVINFTTTFPICNAVPTGLKSTSTTNNSINVAWNSITNVLSYRLQYRKTTENTWTVVSNLTSPNYELKNLSAATSYVIEVATTCQNNVTSKYSTPVIMKTVANTITNCTDKFESNETRTTAKVIATGMTNYGNIGKLGDQDWFKFNNNNIEKYVQIVVNNLHTNAQLRLYDNSGKLLAIAATTSANSKIINYNVGKTGSFYVQIYGNNGYFDAKNCYELKVSLGTGVFKSSQTKEEQTIDNEVIASEDKFFDVKIAPNPATEFANIYIDTNEETLVSFDVIDVTGRVVKHGDLMIDAQNNSIALSVADLQKGMYFLRFLHHNELTIRKLIVE